MIFTTGTFFFTVIPLLVRVSWWTPEPCQHGTARGGITTSLQQTPGQPRRRRAERQRAGAGGSTADSGDADSYPTAQRHSPWGGASWPTSERSRAREDPSDVAGVASSRADVNEQSDDRTHHLMAKALARMSKRRRQSPSSVQVASGTRRSIGGFRLARPGPRAAAEGREVVLADEWVAGQLEPLEGQGRGHMPARRSKERIGRLAVEHGVAVVAPPGREAGAESGRVNLGALDGDRRPAQPVDAADEAGEIEPVGRHVERHDLAAGVDAGVGPPGCGEPRRGGEAPAQVPCAACRPPCARRSSRQSRGTPTRRTRRRSSPARYGAPAARAGRTGSREGPLPLD